MVLADLGHVPFNQDSENFEKGINGTEISWEKFPEILRGKSNGTEIPWEKMSKNFCLPSKVIFFSTNSEKCCSTITENLPKFKPEFFIEYKVSSIASNFADVIKE